MWLNVIKHVFFILLFYSKYKYKHTPFILEGWVTRQQTQVRKFWHREPKTCASTGQGSDVSFANIALPLPGAQGLYCSCTGGKLSLPTLGMPYSMVATPAQGVHLYRPCWRPERWNICTCLVIMDILSMHCILKSSGQIRFGCRRKETSQLKTHLELPQCL